MGVCDAGSEPELEGRGTQLRLSEDVQHVLPAMLSALTTTSIILFIYDINVVYIINTRLLIDDILFKPIK